MASTRRLVLILGVAALGALALPAAAQAAVSCSFDAGTGVLSVTVTNGTTTVAVGRAAGPSTDVLVDDNSDLSSPIVCTNGPGTLSTTSAIVIDESGSAQGTTASLNFANGRLEPGAGSETGTAEIEVSYTADTTGNDQFQIQATGENADQSFRFGAVSGGATTGNLNGDDDADDVTLTGVDQLLVNAGAGNDTLTADGSGSVSFTGPTTIDLRAFGNQGNDTFVAGNGASNQFTGGPGDDSVTGGPGADSFHMEAGNDTFDGAGGSLDFASYENTASATGVTLDLSQTGPQNTGDLGTDQVSNVENVVGSNGSDHLTGTAGNNTIFGGNITQDAGDDVLDGGGGNDDLIGWNGNDVLIGGQGNDQLEGDAGTDTASYAIGSTGAVTMDLDLAKTGVAQATGGAGTDTLVDGSQASDPDTNHEVENLIGSPFAGDVLTGNTLPNLLDGYDGFGDSLDCVAPANGNVAVADELGVDTIANCETVDNAPQTSVVAGPADGASTTDQTPTYTLAADEPSTFELKVDSGPFQPCSASCTTPPLADGAHTLAFRAIDQDENGHADLTPAVRALTVVAPSTPDTTPPETTITAHPKKKTAKRKARFTFDSTEAGSSFLCSIDGRPYAACVSPLVRKKLKRGKHRFAVLATDAAGNSDQTAATFRWKVVKPPR